MTPKQEAALRQAREAFEQIWMGNRPSREKIGEAITAIDEALAEQPAQREPVAWVCHGVNDQHDVDFYENEINALPVGTMLYTSPPASKPWVGLTDDEERKAFEQWYVCNAFDYERNPIGSRECGL